MGTAKDEPGWSPGDPPVVHAAALGTAATPEKATAGGPTTGASAEPDPALGPAVRVPRTQLPAEGRMATVVVNGLATVLARVGGHLHALDSVCPHAGGPLGDGDLDDDAVVCPYHGWAFDLRTGACAVDPSLIVPVHHVVEDVDGALVRLRLAVMPEVR